MNQGRDVRESVVLGHLVEVHPCELEGWRVVVDGEGSHARFSSPFAAWAAGAAESYRRGRGAVASPLHD